MEIGQEEQSITSVSGTRREGWTGRTLGKGGEQVILCKGALAWEAVIPGFKLHLLILMCNQSLLWQFIPIS